MEIVFSLADLEAMQDAIKADKTRPNKPEKTAVFIFENDILKYYRHIGEKERQIFYIKY